jgi:hypothetical protein
MDRYDHVPDRAERVAQARADPAADRYGPAVRGDHDGPDPSDLLRVRDVLARVEEAFTKSVLGPQD